MRRSISLMPWMRPHNPCRHILIVHTHAQAPTPRSCTAIWVHPYTLIVVLPCLQEGSYTVLLAEREQVRRDNDNRREVLRGTWSFARSDGSFQPYAEGVAAELERVFAHVLQRRQECEDADDPDVGLSVDVGGGRRVLYIGNGSWVQQRGEADVGRVGKHLQPMLHRGKSLGLTLITWHPCTQ